MTAALGAVALAVAAALVLPPLLGGTADARPPVAVTSSDPPTSAASPTAAVAPTATATPEPAAALPSGALADLAALRADDATAAADYDRALFGQTWADVDRDGCDTRNDVLGRDLADPAFRAGTDDCKVLTGSLVDPYDGSQVAFVSGATTSGLVQIDHVVALAWAWRHGAESWSDDERLAFANDPANLTAATARTNQAKSDSGPAEWLPDDPARACAFVERFVSVLTAYDLGIDDAERAAAGRVLRECPA